MNTTASYTVYYEQVSAPEQNLQYDCDCAFPVQPINPAPTLTPTQALLAHSPRYIGMLSREQSVTYVPSTSRVALLNTPAVRLLHRLHEPRCLNSFSVSEQPAVQEMVAAGLVYPMGVAPQPQPAAPALVAWLHITNACTLDCAYCYIRKSGAAMSAETAHRAVDAVLRSATRHGYTDVHLKYAGGEPTLNLPLIEQTHRYAQQHAAATGLTMHGVVLSNGVGISDTQLQHIHNLGLRLMISLDGPQRVHDRQRTRVDGSGSYGDVVSTIAHAQQLGLHLTISVTVTAASIAGLPELVAWLRERDVHFTLNFCREHGNAQTSCATPTTHLVPDEEARIIAGMRAAYRIIEHNLPNYSLLGSLLDRTNLSGSHRHTCPVGEHYLVIDHQGNIAKCQMDIAHPVTSITAADPLGAVRADQQRVQNIPVEQKEGCQTCEWRYWCAGGCPLVTHQATGRYDVPSPLCGVYRALFPDIIRLEGLRLAQQQG